MEAASRPDSTLRALQPPPNEPLFEFEGYQVVQHLGGGSFAETYKAWRAGQWFAVKIFREPVLSEDARARLRIEFLALDIDHPNLVGCVDLQVDGRHPLTGASVPYVVMPFVEATNLQKVVEEAGGRLPVDRAVNIGKQVAAALSALHRQGFFHRDLKPANILVGENDHVLVIDFGLAKAADLSTNTATGVIPGSPPYFAPEQIMGSATPHTDLFALGVVLYEILSGDRPFRGNTMFELLEAIKTEDHAPVRSSNPEVPQWLESLIDDLLEKAPADRPPSASGVSKFLEAGDTSPPARPAEYLHQGRPILGFRAHEPSPAKAIADAAVSGETLDYALGTFSRPSIRRDLAAANQWNDTRIGIDTRVELCGFPFFTSRVYVRNAPFAPSEAGGYFTADDLRSPEKRNELVRADLRHQAKASQGLFRATSFIFQSAEDRMLAINGHLLAHSIDAADALDAEANLHAPVRFPVQAICRPEDRVKILNTLNRGPVDAYIVEPIDVGVGTPHLMLADLLEFCLMIQTRLGRPAILRLPDELAEIAWSVGIAGVEVVLGRTGSLSMPKIQHHFSAPSTRFDFGSLMASFAEKKSLSLLDCPDVQETFCTCSGCANRTPGSRLSHYAHDHGIHRWLKRQEAVAGVNADYRLQEFQTRLREAEAAWKAAGPILARTKPAHLKLMSATLAEMTERIARSRRQAIRAVA